MVIFRGDDAPQVSGTEKANRIVIRVGIASALPRNVSGCAKDIEKTCLLPILRVFRPFGAEYR
jgi:hypothetical protein